ncbi:hypothetical protein IAD21_06273 [Abditibacteriota bacterium]|nr:hypothetical protein IAD21_06273 [Abditibacteriota bacterium]
MTANINSRAMILSNSQLSSKVTVTALEFSMYERNKCNKSYSPG